MGNETERHISDTAGEARARSARHEVPIAAPTGGGEALDHATRAYFEPRFGHDFSQVRVHHDARAAGSARRVDALAYTSSHDIVFGAGQYSPETVPGRRLLAHELAHVVQQAATASALPQSKAMVGESSSAAERIADNAAAVFSHPTIPPRHSAALKIRDQLRAHALPGPVIQRAVSTWGGEFDTDKYDLTTDPGMDGVDIKLRFKPNKYVNATSIAMTQTVRSAERGVPFAVGTGAEKTTLEARSIPTAEAGAGRRIDQAAANVNPLYAVETTAAGGTLSSVAASATWGRHGWRYVDSAGTVQQQDALLNDTPQLSSARTETSQVFETTATAVTGVQEGTYYGSVEWGWEKDAAGTVSKRALAVVSTDVPSSAFARAAELWNAAKTPAGTESIDLPVALGKYTNTANVWLVSDPARYQATLIDKLAKNTRLELTSERRNWGKVTVVDGAHIGKVGWVMKTLMSDARS